MKDSILYPYSAIFFGIVLGIAAGVPVQATLNGYESTQCKAKTYTHQLVSARGFWGESKHCIDRRYL